MYRNTFYGLAAKCMHRHENGQAELDSHAAIRKTAEDKNIQLEMC